MLALDALEVNERGGVGHRFDAHLEAGVAGEAEGVGPRERDRAGRAGYGDRRGLGERPAGGHRQGGGRFGRGRLAGGGEGFGGAVGAGRAEGGAGEVPRRLEAERHAAAVDHGECAAAQVGDAGLDPEVVGVVDGGGQAVGGRPQRRLYGRLVAGVADLDADGAGCLLAGELEAVAAVGEGGGDGWLGAEAGDAVGRLPFGVGGEGEGEFERLAEGDDQACRRRGELGERVARGVREREQPALERVEAGARRERQGGAGQEQQGEHAERPAAVHRGRERLFELAALRLVGDVFHRRAAQARRQRLGGFHLVLQLDDPEQAVAEAGVAPGDQARELRLAPVAEHPAVQPVGREQDEQRGARQQDPEAHRRRRRPQAVEPEHQQVRAQQAERAGQHRLGHLDPPQAATELLKLLPQRLRDRLLVRFRCGGHAEQAAGGRPAQPPRGYDGMRADFLAGKRPRPPRLSARRRPPLVRPGDAPRMAGRPFPEWSGWGRPVGTGGSPRAEVTGTPSPGSSTCRRRTSRRLRAGSRRR